MNVVDTVVASFFVIDLIFHSVAFGFILHPNAYLRQSVWFYVDLIVAIGSLSYLWLPGNILLRCIRSLRFVKLNEFFRSTRFVNTSMFTALSQIASVIVFIGIILVAFAVISVHFFGGMST